MVTVIVAAPVCLGIAQSNNALIRAKRIRFISSFTLELSNRPKIKKIFRAKSSKNDHFVVDLLRRFLSMADPSPNGGGSALLP